MWRAHGEASVGCDSMNGQPPGQRGQTSKRGFGAELLLILCVLLPLIVIFLLPTGGLVGSGVFFWLSLLMCFWMIYNAARDFLSAGRGRSAGTAGAAQSAGRGATRSGQRGHGRALGRGRKRCADFSRSATRACDRRLCEAEERLRERDVAVDCGRRTIRRVHPARPRCEDRGHGGEARVCVGELVALRAICPDDDLGRCRASRRELASRA